MRQRLRARELWLFAPFLLILAGAFYWQRIEQASKPGNRRMFVSGFKVEPASGYWQEKGYSHQVEVKISHPWPRPKWWGETGNIGSQCDPLRPEVPESLIAGTKPNQYVAPGGALTVMRKGKRVRWGAKGRQGPINHRFENNQYLFEHHLKLSEVPRAEGAVTFHGLYRIVGQPQIAVQREIRKAGETLPMKPNKNPGAQLVETITNPFYILNSGKTRFDACTVGLIVRHFDTTKGKNPDVQIYDVEIHDANGKSYRDDGGQVFMARNVILELPDNRQLQPDESFRGLSIRINRIFRLTDELTITGKIAADEHWPLKFKFIANPKGVVRSQ